MMMIADAQDNSLTGASEAAARLYDQALVELQCYVGDPAATIERALAESPETVMAHALKAHLFLVGTEKAGLPVAREALQTALQLPSNAREKGHLKAIGHALAGNLGGCREALDDVLVEHPRDALALQAGHLWDFFVGDARSLRDRPARVLPAWTDGTPGYHAVLSMHAFGLEECGDYARAEERGRRAVAMNPRDCWGTHAVAHVLEMQGRIDQGIAWLRGNEAGWATDSFMAVHNWWHLALFHLDQGDHRQALELYDGPIRGTRSTVHLDMVDASAMLWRLHLRGVDAGGRWRELAEAWAPHAEDAHYAFNDAHAMIAFVGAEREDLAETLLAAMTARVGRGGSNDRMTRDIGLPVARAIHAFGQGDYTRAVALLRPIRSVANRFGGSHAQRDLLDLTLAEAALRSNQHGLAARLAAERIDLKPSSPLGWLFARRARNGRTVAEAA